MNHKGMLIADLHIGSINSMKHYRELYNMKIIDSTLDRQYGIYLNNLINQTTSTEE